MQVAVIEYARHVAGIEDAISTEFDANAASPLIGLITEWMTEEGAKEIRGHADDLGRHYASGCSGLSSEGRYYCA